jgi:hypothetical protein
MAQYSNTSGRSSISSYDYGDGFIKVFFKDGGSYTYTNASVGADTVKAMIQMAKEGQGLNGFINSNVKEDYANYNDFE